MYFEIKSKILNSNRHGIKFIINRVSTIDWKGWFYFLVDTSDYIYQNTNSKIIVLKNFKKHVGYWITILTVSQLFVGATIESLDINIFLEKILQTMLKSVLLGGEI